MLLNDGYVQRAKIAYREDHEPVIQRWERKAFDAAMHAATLESENDERAASLRIAVPDWLSWPQDNEG